MNYSKTKKAQQSAYVFLMLFIAIVSVFVTISVVGGDDSIPTGLVVDEEIQNQINNEKSIIEEQKNSCDYDSWFKRFTCKIGVYDWFFKETQTTTVYTLDEDGNVIDATVFDGDIAKGEVSIDLED